MATGLDLFISWYIIELVQSNNDVFEGTYEICSEKKKEKDDSSTKIDLPRTSEVNNDEVLRDRIRQLENEKNNIEKSKTNLTYEINSIKSINSELTTENNKLKFKNKKMEEENNRLAADLAKLDEELKKLRKG